MIIIFFDICIFKILGNDDDDGDDDRDISNNNNIFWYEMVLTILKVANGAPNIQMLKLKY